MIYGYTMISESLAIAPVVCDNGWDVCGIDGNMLHLIKNDEERRIELPFYDGGGCEVESYRVDCGDDYTDVHMLIPHERGRMVCRVSADWSKGQLFAVARVGLPDSQR